MNRVGRKPSSKSLDPGGFEDLFFKKAPYSIDVGREIARSLDAQRSRTRKIDGNDLLHSSWARSEHDDAVGQEDRFVDLVGDKDNCFSFRIPNAGKLDLHDLPGLSV